MSGEGRADAPARPALGADLVIPLLAVASAVYFLADTRGLVWEARANGTVIGVVLLALSGAQLARIAMRVWGGRASLGLGSLAEWSPIQAQRLGLFSSMVLFIVAIPYLGTTLSLFLVMIATMRILGVRDWRMLLGISLTVAATVFLLFMALLQSRLPVGAVDNLLLPLVGR